jgi:hypothetical protein
MNLHPRRIAALAAALLLSAGVVATPTVAADPPNGPPGTVADGKWKDMAVKAYPDAAGALFGLEATGGLVKAQYISGPAWAAGLQFGWNDHRTQVWLKQIYQHRRPSGGYGSEEPFDAFYNGTTNDAQTTYTISTAWHIGQLFIPAYDAGAVPRKWIVDGVRTLLDTGEDQGPAGPCIRYSMNPNDANQPCVYYVVGAAAWYLTEAAHRGLVPAGRTTELWAKVARWTATLRAAYNPAVGDWQYSSNQPIGTREGPVYNEVIVMAMYSLDRGFAEQATAAHFANWPTSTLQIISKDCSHADAMYPIALAAATAPVPNLTAMVGRSTYATFAMLIHQECGGT